jgi:hypothetical protein
MTERIIIYRKGTAGIDDEAWSRVGMDRRAHIWRLTTNDALAQSATFDANVTHAADVDYSDDYRPAGSGSRVIKRLTDGQEYVVVGATEHGLRGRNGVYRYMRLALTRSNQAVV